jgi:D-alanyl-D-alanine carboxypeptidase (penicillin-binding protein 5/6)
MQNPYFCEIVKTEYKTIPWEGHEWDRVVKNKNKILWNYEGGNGIKTGYTKEAGRCLCAAAQRGGMQLISVVLDAPDMFADSMTMLDQGFANYQNCLIIEAGEYLGDVAVEQGTKEKFSVYTQKDVYYPLTTEEQVQVQKKVHFETTVVDAPVEKGQKVGFIDIWLGDRKIYTEDLAAPHVIGENSFKYNLEKILKDWVNKRILGAS